MRDAKEANTANMPTNRSSPTGVVVVRDQHAPADESLLLLLRLERRARRIGVAKRDAELRLSAPWLARDALGTGRDVEGAVALAVIGLGTCNPHSLGPLLFAAAGGEGKKSQFLTG